MRIFGPIRRLSPSGGSRNGSFWGRAGFLYFAGQQSGSREFSIVLFTPRRARPEKQSLQRREAFLWNSWLSKNTPIIWSIIYTRVAAGRPTMRYGVCPGNRAITRNYRGGDGDGRASSTEYCSDERGRRINLPLLLARRSLKKKPRDNLRPAAMKNALKSRERN